MKIVIQRKCNRWINVSNYNSEIKELYENLEEAEKEMDALKELQPHAEYRLAEWIGGRKYRAI